MNAHNSMRSRAMMLAAAAMASALLGATPAPSPNASQSPTVGDILARMAAARKGLNSFSVPVHFDVRIKRPLSVSLPLDGVRYFERPDKGALEMKSVPAIAKAFQQTYAGLGSPETWPGQYDLSLVDQPASATIYELKGVPKNGGNVDHILLDVDRDTSAPIRARWFYRNGATIDMAIENAQVNGMFLLPKTETLEVAFPSYAGQAVVHYGDYTINQPIPASVWQQSPQP